MKRKGKSKRTTRQIDWWRSKCCLLTTPQTNRHEARNATPNSKRTDQQQRTEKKLSARPQPTAAPCTTTISREQIVADAVPATQATTTTCLTIQLTCRQEAPGLEEGVELSAFDVTHILAQLSTCPPAQSSSTATESEATTSSYLCLFLLDR